jgi:hypothetical protein
VGDMADVDEVAVVEGIEVAFEASLTTCCWMCCCKNIWCCRTFM